MQRMHFISGLPRSGSTLLSAILRQNPKFRAGMSGPVSSLFLGLLAAMSARSEFHSMISAEKRQAVLRGVLANYYSDEPEDAVIFDTSRAWTAKLAALDLILPEAKVICCVRSVAWILDSFERLVQKNSLEPSKMYHFDPAGNYRTRLEQLSGPKGVVGTAYSSLKGAFYSEFTSKLVFVTYRSLVTEPKNTMQKLYEAIGEPYFDHDFENVSYDAEEFDMRMGTPGLHKVYGAVRAPDRKPILPPEVFAKFKGHAFWATPDLNTRGVAII